ncbi:hypothetical protein [Streptomyces sp. NPDC058398]|uniref:hypothetical protein n=1 Tax=Streptomyces sp. NPDC058398 TaxID=3346479 RepID=UPI0036609AEE
MSDHPEIAARAAHGTDGQNAVRPDRSDASRCISVHWSLPVQCVLPSSHRENWHEAWHPKSGNRLRFQRSMGGYRTEELHHGEWHDLQLAPPGGFCGLLRSDRPDVRCTEQYGHGWMHRAKVDGVQHTWSTAPVPGLNADQLTRDVKQLRGMVVEAHARVADLGNALAATGRSLSSFIFDSDDPGTNALGAQWLYHQAMPQADDPFAQPRAFRSSVFSEASKAVEEMDVPASDEDGERPQAYRDGYLAALDDAAEALEKRADQAAEGTEVTS